MTRCGDVIIIGIIGYKGPKGGPGMRETLSTASAIYGQGMSSQGALISEGRFSGATRGFCVAISDRKPLWVGRWRCWAMATTP